MPNQKGPSNRSQGGRSNNTGKPAQNRKPAGQNATRPTRRPANRPEVKDQIPPQTPELPDEPVEIAPADLEPPDYIIIAQISSPFGLRGAVKALIQTDFPERFEQLESVFLSPPGTGAIVGSERQERPLLSARVQNEKQVVLRFEGITKIEQAETLRGYNVSIPVDEVMPLPAGEFYIFQIIGLEVYSTENEYVGVVVNVERMPANDIYLVRGPLSKKDVLIPAIKDVVKNIDLEAGKITIELLEGLI